MKDEADLEIRRRETSRVIVFVPRRFSVAVPLWSSVHSRFQRLA